MSSPEPRKTVEQADKTWYQTETGKSPVAESGETHTGDKPAQIPDFQAYLAEFIGTFLLVLVGAGTAVVAGWRVGQLGIALAFGLTLLLLVYAIGPISGCHVNPAVTLGHLVMGRIPTAKAVGYWVAQFVGGLLAGVVLVAIAKDLPEYRRSVDGLAANGWGDHSPSALTDPVTGHTYHGYGIASMIIVEIVLTALLVFVVLATTDRIADKLLAGVAIGFTLTVIYLISLPIDNTSVNPARSLGVAPWQDGAIGQVWAFIVFPLVGGILGAVVYSVVYGRFSSADRAMR
jgi:aquaporin Z